ncbi:heavy-metal-associated domain-containing protein [Candidatus Gottesmanbacteria bacterium]|nr:heavy-metal-associated domain-containing protein [Candidatus Gottesmanbacteria bacterium]
MMKKTYKLKGMHCTSCAMVIEGELEDIGVKASCSYARETVDVEYDEKKLSEDTIKNVIVKAGYQTVDSG